MNDYSKTFLHLKKSESLIKKNKLNLGNSNRKIRNNKKLTTKEDKSLFKEKREHSYICKETINERKKMINSKSFNYGRNKSHEKINKSGINNIKNKIIKKVNGNSRNHKNFFDNYEKNKMKKKMLINNRNNSNNNMNKTYVTNNISQINDMKYANSYFNTLFINNEKKNDEDNYFSLSQNIASKKNNVLRKINTNLMAYNDKLKNDISNEEPEYNRSYTNFYKNKTKTRFNSNYLLTNNNDNENIRHNYPNNNQVPQNPRIKPSIKIYNDNNTTINLEGSYNFHQYFNTIINNNNKNNDDISNDRIRKNNLIDRYYNRNKTIIDNYNKKVYNNINYCQTQISSTENDTKYTNIFFNDKLIKDIDDLKNNMVKNLKENPTNSKSKKYNTLKANFEKLLKLINEYFHNNCNTICIFLEKLIIGYHEVVLAFSEENRKFKELNFKLTEQYEKIDKDLIECNKIIKEKQNKIENLEKKLSGLINSMKKINFNNIKIKYDNINLNNNFFEKFKIREKNDLNHLNNRINEQFIKIKTINENNLDDLDALYFFDKVKMKEKKSFSCGKIIPFLQINK